MDLATTYLGLKLRTPLVCAASPLSQQLDNLKKMEDAGASAVVLYSLFEEQLRQDSLELQGNLERGALSSPEAMSYFPEPEEFNVGPEQYLAHIQRAKQAVAIPVIASLNACSAGGWTRYARGIQDAGADALELNIYHIAVNPDETAADVEQRYVDLVKAVKAEVRIPVAVKLGPYFSSMANMARKLDAAGANALVIFNRFYQPDYDLEALEVVPNLILSNSHELLLRLHWIAVIYGSVHANLALTGGVHSATDVVKAMMAGARVAMMTSALLRNGIGHLATVQTELLKWMEEHEYESIHQMQGSMSQRAVADPSAFQRANYVKVLSSYALKAGAQ